MRPKIASGGRVRPPGTSGGRSTASWRSCPRSRLSTRATASRASRRLRAPIHEAEVTACIALSDLGAEIVPDGATILTYCNAGALATGGYGTALGVIRSAQARGKNVRVIACETRPLLQGARLTAWELVRAGIPVEVITDSMAGALFAARAIDLVVVGADRVARSGDIANKIGTYSIACLAQMHGVPFDVAAPWSTVDLECPDGSRIPIERRADVEVTHFVDPAGTGGRRCSSPRVPRCRTRRSMSPRRAWYARFTQREAPYDPSAPPGSSR